MRLRPVRDTVVVKRQAAETQTPGGLVIPSNVQDKVSRGEVLEVGPGTTNDQGWWQLPPATTGQVVLYAKLAGVEVRVDGEDYVILESGQILGILE